MELNVRRNMEHRHNAVFYTLVVDASDVTLQNTASWQILLVLAHVHQFRSGLRDIDQPSFRFISLLPLHHTYIHSFHFDLEPDYFA